MTVSESSAARILASVAGDVLYAAGEGRRVVTQSCYAAGRAFGCITCGVRLANRYQVELHTESGTHVLCRLCDLHGAEEWEPDVTPATPPSEKPAMATTVKPRSKSTAAKKSTTTKSPTSTPAPVVGDQLLRIPVAQVEPSPYQPRRTFDEAELAELAASLEASGLLQPISVRTLPDARHYELIAGERRWRAAQRLGWTEIPAVVKTMGDEEAAALALVENLQRADLSPLEEAQAYKRLMKERGWSQSELARRTGVSRSSIGDRLGLLEIGPWLELLAAGEITVSQAVELRKWSGAPLGVHQAAIAEARRETTRGDGSTGTGLADVEVRTFRMGIVRWYRDALYPLEPGPAWECHPQFDTSDHDKTCDCGRVRTNGFGQHATRDHCLNPGWWRPRHEAALAAQPNVSREDEDPWDQQEEARAREARDRWNDQGVKIQLPQGSETLDHNGWGAPDGYERLTDTTGRWGVVVGPSLGEFDPADLPPIAPDELALVRDLRTGGHYIATSALDAVTTARQRWAERWERRTEELRAELAATDYTLRGAGVRFYLLDLADREDDDLCKVLSASDQVPGEVKAELEEEYPGTVTLPWLRTAPLELLEQLATAYLVHCATDGYSSPLAQRIRDERRQALEEIRARSVPWVTERPAALGKQADFLDDGEEVESDDLPDPADELEEVDA